MLIFNSKHPNDTSLYHYYEPDFRKECDYYKASEGMLRYGHKFITEKAVFSKWSLTFGNIHFHYPSWTPKAPVNATELDTPFLRTYREALLNGSLAELQSIPKKKKKIIRKKKIIKIVRRKRVKSAKNSSSTTAQKQPKRKVDTLSGGDKIEETVLVLNNSKDKGNLADEVRDPEAVKRAELMRLARRKIISARRH